VGVAADQGEHGRLFDAPERIGVSRLFSRMVPKLPDPAAFIAFRAANPE
jgi:hypothetical protein